MKSTDIPKLMTIPFGISGQREDLLESSASGDNTASYNQGFPSITMIDLDAGGMPPKGQDFNQILYELANGLRWANAGRLYQYDSTWSTANNGYPLGAMVIGTDNQTIYMSSADDNTTDPNSTSSSNWVSQSSKYLQTANLLSEISSLGSTAQVSSQKNIGIADSNGYIGRLVNIKVINSTSTYTPTSNTKKVLVRMIGGGGGGGGTPATSQGYSSAAGGGGAGCEITSLITVNFTSITVTIGAGGTVTVGGKGGDGGVSSFGSLISCSGGSGGVVAGSSNAPYFYSPGGGGSSSTGSYLFVKRGDDGLAGQLFNGTTAFSGSGASSALGKGGSSIGVVAGGAYYYGSAASGFGSGGGGGVSTGASPATSGGTGSSGMCIIYEYI